MLKGLAKLLRMGHNTPDTITIQEQVMTEDLITTEEAARILGVTPAYIRRLCAKSKLDGKRYGRDWLIPRKSVLDFAATERKPGRPRLDKIDTQGILLLYLEYRGVSMRRLLGHIYQRGKKGRSWTIMVDIGHDPVTGKRKQLSRAIKGTKTDAERALARIIHDIDSGYIMPTDLTVADFMRQWLRDYVTHGVGPVTTKGYKHWTEKHIIPSLGNLKLTQLQPSHIQAFYRKMLESGRRDGKGALSPRSVLHVHRLLHNALSHAVKWGIIGRNVCEAVDPPRVRQKQMRALDAEDVNRLLEASKDTIYYPLFHLAVFTGMRRSELLGLRWCDVDLDMATLSVVQTLHCLSKGKIVFQEPKTQKSKRQIDLSPTAVIALREHRQKQEVERLMLGSTLAPDDLVFTNLDGTPLLPNSVTHAFIKTVRRLGLHGVRFHDLRHTHATLLLRQGVNIKALQERLGHSTITTTLDIYAHVTPGMQKEAALRFDEALQAANNKSSVPIMGGR